jgi:hypothetical protein
MRERKRCIMADTVRTQIELPRDMFELLRRRSKEQGITPTQQIVEALTTYLQQETDPILQSDDPLLSAVPEMSSGLRDLSTDHDRYLYCRDWQARNPRAEPPRG